MWQRRRLWPVFPCVLCVVLALAVVCQRIELMQIRRQQEEARDGLMRDLELRERLEGANVVVEVPDPGEIDEEQVKQIQHSVLEQSHLLHTGHAPGASR